jgi:nitroreductase
MRKNKMNNLELIKTRRSVRTFDGKPLSEEDKNKLIEFGKNIPNPYNIPVEFIYLDAKEHGVSSPVITGENAYFAAKVKLSEHSEEAFGYSFEKFVLYAWSLGIGTTWIGGTMKRELFENEAGVGEDERMYCVTPVGYPAKKKSIKEIAMRTGVRADYRKEARELFFENDFGTPLSHVEDTVKNALEAVRLGPSAVNKQPWRIVKCGNSYHFYVRHDKGYSEHPKGDIQMVDMGIALCHFMDFAGGELSINNPGIKVPEDCIEYVATVTV